MWKFPCKLAIASFHSVRLLGINFIACLITICALFVDRSLYITQILQGGGIPIYSVLRSSSLIKIKVNSQLEIFSIVNGQATISLMYTVKMVKVKRNFSDKTHNRKINAKQKHLGCKKGDANQKQQLSDYKSIHSYTCN